MTDQYAGVAPRYDRMAADPGIKPFYTEWRQALLDAARKHGVSVRVLVDLACGTGNTAIRWTRRGWNVIGVDASAAMPRQMSRRGGGAQDAERSGDVRDD
jgi:ubiquinone/menaquinone biosynthesis C-methylase UbiE